MTRPDRYKTVSRCVDILDDGEPSETYFRDEHGRGYYPDVAGAVRRADRVGALQ